MRFGSPLLRRVDGWVMGAALVGLVADVSYGQVHDSDRRVLPNPAADDARSNMLHPELRRKVSPAAKQPERTAKRRQPQWVFPIGGLVTGGLAAGAVVTHAAARERQEELRSLHLSASECFRSSSARCQRASVLADEVERGRNAAWALGSGAVAAASATVLLWWFWEVDEPVVVGIGPGFEHVKVNWTHAF